MSINSAFLRVTITYSSRSLDNFPTTHESDLVLTIISPSFQLEKSSLKSAHVYCEIPY